MKRVKVALVAAAVVAGVATIPTPVGASAECAITALPVPDGALFSAVNGTDPTGRYLVGSGSPNGPSEMQSLVWHDGMLTVLPIPLAGSVASAVNSAGSVVGSGFRAGLNRAWRFADGEYRELPLPAGATAGFAVDINSRGDSLIGYSTVDDPSQVAVLPAGAASVRILSLPPGYGAIPTGISDDGTVTARADPLTGDGLTRSFVWDARGSRQELLGTGVGRAVAVWASSGRWAAGTEYDPVTDVLTPLRWRLSGPLVAQVRRPAVIMATTSGPPAARDASARARIPQPIRVSRANPQRLPAELTVLGAVNDRGVVGGQADNSAAAVVQNGQLLRLSKRANSRAGYVQAVSNTGVIAGADIDADFNSRAATWTCG